MTRVSREETIRSVAFEEGYKRGLKEGIDSQVEHADHRIVLCQKCGAPVTFVLGKFETKVPEE